MKSLYNSLNEASVLDIEGTIIDGDKFDKFFKKAEAELNEIRNMTWEDILDTCKFEDGQLACTFKFTCPNLLTLLGINHPDAYGLIIVVEIRQSYNVYSVFTINHKKHRNYSTSMIAKGWVNITDYIGPIRPKKMSNAILQIQDALHKLANIETLKSLCLELKMK